MPSLKRVQSSPDSEDPSDDDTETPASASPPPSRKRPRTSESPASQETLDSDDGITPDTEPLEDEDEDEEELEFRQTQIIKEKYAHSIDDIVNKPAEHGILEKVECYNFMCHSYFTVELGPLINFIVGKNGSGKSAILTAITLCLGGKASATQRGGSLKSFIKQGKESATIMVKIKNQGEGAFMPADYGESIIVERHFTRAGTSGFKIKSAKGRIVSTKKAELDAITDYFSMQIDNPMNVLSQDSARQFLSTSSPAEKYKFFVKGVQLEQLDQDYRLIEESVDQIEEKLRNNADHMKALETDRNNAKRKLEISDQHEALRERKRRFVNQLAWAHVEDQEKIRDTISQALTEADESIANSEAALGEFDEKFRTIDAESETAAEHAYRADRALEEGRGEQEAIQDKINAKMLERAELQAQQRTIRDYLKAAESRIQTNQEKIDEENRRLAEITDGSHARKQQEYEEATNNAKEAAQELEQHSAAEAALQSDCREAEQEENNANTEYMAKKRELEQAENRLHSLRQEDGQRRTGFPEKMPSLLRAIESERSFRERPVGPLGHYITLLKPKWASVLEGSLNTTLSSFVVTSKADQMILSGLMRKTNCTCPVFIGSGSDLDTSATEPDPQFDTALRILEISHPMVRRQIIIGHAVEQMLLIENVEEASKVLFDGERLKNVKRCYSIDPRDRSRGIHLSYNRMGDPTQGPVPPYRGHPRMKSDLASQVSNQREVVQDLKRQLNELENNLRSARSRMQSCKQALVRHRREAAELKVKMQRLEDDAEALRDALDKENVEDGLLDALRTALREAEDDKQINEGSYNDSITAMENMVQVLKEMRREKSAMDKHIDELLERSRVAGSEQSLVENKRRELINEKNMAVADIEKEKSDRARLDDKLQQAEARVLSNTEQAAMITERVEIDEGETAASLDQKISKLTRDLIRYSKELGGTREELAAAAGRTEANYSQAKRKVEENTFLAQALKDTLVERKRRWGLFRAHISSRAKAQFTYLLSERSFRGRLLADHVNRVLDLQVEPDITKVDNTGRGAKTLSGGEKSFSQICLLLALWEAMGSPIRCLDEFDVYMDHINRKMAIDMLMLAARRSTGRQYILITPGTKTDITIAPDVRVKELAEPERGQTTLRFQG